MMVTYKMNSKYAKTINQIRYNISTNTSSFETGNIYINFVIQTY